MERGSRRLPRWGVAVELGRPVVLLGLFGGLAARGWWWAAAPVSLAAVFAASVLVHDLIHGSLGLSRRANETALALAALLLVKSGHGLRVLHLAHHRRCLHDDDVEGRVARASFASLALGGPWLALESRVEAYRQDHRTRGLQVAETVANVAVLAGGAALHVLTHSPALLVYWACVVLVTITAPIWGAKIPHMVPFDHPVVRRLASLTGRFTPATASVLLHELHHRAPSLPVSLLPENAHRLSASEPSPCEPPAR